MTYDTKKGREKKEKFLNLDASSLNDHIKKLENEILIAKECLKYVEGKNVPTGEQRKNFLEGISAKKLKNITPESALDSSQDKNKTKKLGSHQKNTGAYLWREGYDPEKLLGSGANGVVWKCDGNKAIKVTCDKKFGPFKLVNATKEEIEDVEKMKGILEEDHKYISYKKENLKKGTKDIKAKKYLALNETGSKINDNKQIFASELAKGDLTSKVSEIQGKKDVSNIIKMGTQALKALKVIHDAGYSHNDVKPDNLLVVERVSKKLGVNKDTIQLADFGAMTKINETSKIFVNSNFSAPDWYKTSPAAVAKRDVYALGAVLLFMLVPNKSIGDSKKMAKYLYSNGPEKFYDKYKLESIYKPAQKSKIINLLIVVQLMVADSYSSRISVDVALDKMQQIKVSS